jgi:hypothetical protein
MPKSRVNIYHDNNNCSVSDLFNLCVSLTKRVHIKTVQNGVSKALL